MNDFFAAVAHTILLAICGFFLTVHNTQAAEPYLVLGGGITQFNSYASDPAHDNARFCDRGFQCDEQTNSHAWQIGAGLKFDKPRLGLNWATELYYADFGTMKLNSQFPPDDQYSVATHSCVGDCSPENLLSFKGDWRAHGPVIALLPSYRWNNISLYGKAGLAIMFISGHAYATAPGGSTFTDCSLGCKANSTRYGPIAGAGIGYEGFKYVKPFVEFNHIQTYGGGFPGFTSWQSYMAGIRIPLR